MRRYWLILSLLLYMTIPLQAQDNPTPYDIALQRIQEAADSGATELQLSTLGLTEVPSEVWHLISLEGLYLNGNELTSLPPEISLLINLHVLGVTNNHLTSLPPEIGQLTKLEILGLSDNRLTSVPAEIGHLHSLRWLSLHHNQLTSVPAEIGRLNSLEVLSLHNNRLQHLPATIGNLTNLKNLILIENSLISPPPEVIEQGTAAVLAYLRNQAWYHMQRMIIGAASGVGLLAAFVLGLRYRRTRGKSKAKRG
jgi:Leucine-rich repeat (LRR) protein